MKNIDLRCWRCNTEMIKGTTALKVKFQGEELTLDNIRCYKCSECGEINFDWEYARLINEFSMIDGVEFAGFINEKEG